LKRTVEDEGYAFDGQMIRWKRSKRDTHEHEQGCADSTADRYNDRYEEGLKRKEQKAFKWNFKKQRTGLNTAVVVKVQQGGRLIP
jgi:hypothetical protein